MARTPARDMPKAYSRAAYPNRRKIAAMLVALVGLGLVTTTRAQPSARGCDEWHAELLAAEGVIEVQRSGAPEWTPATRGAVICLGDAV